jgi:hypothetical protein
MPQLKAQIFFIFISLITLQNIFAYDSLNYQKYDWQEERKMLSLNEDEKNLPIVFLKENIMYEYAYEDDGEKLVLYYTLHKIIKVNSDDAIEQFNKMYISLYETLDLVELKVRSIQPDGKVVELNKDNIKEIENEESQGSYKIFAIEGVEKGSEIEYLYTKKMESTYYDRDFFQYGAPIKEASFELISPDNLIFETKSYHGFPESEIKVEEGKRYLKIVAQNIPALKQEAFSFYAANRMRVDYKLAYNNAMQEDRRLFTWQDGAKRIYGNMQQLGKEEEKSLEKLIKTLKLKKGSQEQKVRKLENYIKANIAIQEGFSEEFYNLSAVLKNKYGKRVAINRLYLHLFEILAIEYQLVMTTDRSEVKFDKDFDSWQYLEKTMFYFPKTKKFLAPDMPTLRYGIVPALQTAQYGLFITAKKQKKDTQTELNAQTRYINELNDENNADVFDANMEFTEDMTQIKLDLTRKLFGHNASGLHVIYALIAEDKKKELLESFVKGTFADADVDKLDTGETSIEYSSLDKPFIFKSQIKTASLIERAGNKYLFKIGDVIGPQTELYQENERKQEVENNFNRIYKRYLNFKIPTGYKIKNPDDLLMDVSHTQDGQKASIFTSNYEIKNDVLQVTVIEYYKEIYSPLSLFEDFRKVINAAADFNKIVLVLEKK